MSRLCLVRCLLACLPGLMAFSQAQAWEKIPIKVDAAFNIRFNVKVGPSNQHKAPWYSYFPYDPSLHPSAGGNPYPNWPAQFPPSEGTSNDKSAQAGRFPNWPATSPQSPGSPPESENRTGAYASLTSHSPTSQAPGSVYQTSNFSPVSAPSTRLAWQPYLPGQQGPSYWNGR